MPQAPEWDAVADPQGDGEFSGGVVLCHGFSRGPRAMSALAWRCQATGLRTFRPAYPSFGRHGLNSSRLVTQLADLIAALPGVARERRPGLVLVGHSAGAAVAAALSRRLVARSIRVAGLVFVDGVDNRAEMVKDVVESTDAPALPAILLVDSRPSRCNREGALSRMLLETVPVVGGWQIHGAGHGDVERWIPGAPGIVNGPVGHARSRPGMAYRLACGDASDLSTAALVQTLAELSVARLAAERVAEGPWTMSELAQIQAAAGAVASGPRDTVTTLLPSSARGH